MVCKYDAKIKAPQAKTIPFRAKRALGRVLLYADGAQLCYTTDAVGYADDFRDHSATT